MKYTVKIYRLRNGKEELAQETEAKNATIALYTLAKFYVGREGFGNVSRVECHWRETGVKQWQLTIG